MVKITPSGFIVPSGTTWNAAVQPVVSGSPDFDGHGCGERNEPKASRSTGWGDGWYSIWYYGLVGDGHGGGQGYPMRVRRDARGCDVFAIDPYDMSMGSLLAAHSEDRLYDFDVDGVGASWCASVTAFVGEGLLVHSLVRVLG